MHSEGSAGSPAPVLAPSCYLCQLTLIDQGTWARGHVEGVPRNQPGTVATAPVAFLVLYSKY